MNPQEFTHILLKKHFISTLQHSEIFQPKQGLPQGVRLINFSTKVSKLSHQIQNPTY